MNTFFQPIEKQSHDNQRIFAQRALIHDVTEDILIAMDDLNISKTELANRLGKSKSFITQTLNGSRNMTLATLSDICFELNIKPTVYIIPQEQRLTEHAKQILLEKQTSQAGSWHKESPQKLGFGRYNKVISIEKHPNFDRAA